MDQKRKFTRALNILADEALMLGDVNRHQAVGILQETIARIIDGPLLLAAEKERAKTLASKRKP